MASKEVENESYAQFCMRVAKSLGDRVGAGDPHHLSYIRTLRDVVAEAEGRAILGLLAQGYSYAEIGAGLGISRQAVHKASVVYKHTTF
jgi:DNA invertase Pin-like site-specific DNA recombinase